MLSVFQLPFHFDPERLRADLDRIQPDEWMPHYNPSVYEGNWSGVALRSVGGYAAQLYPDPAADARFSDTPVLERSPYFQSVLATFRCPLEAVRLLKLAAGSSILEHSDYNLGYDDGDLRLHIPIITNPDVAFFLNGERVPMQPGETWYLNLNLPHRVENRSAIDRVHLVIDCVVNDWVREIFAAAGG